MCQIKDNNDYPLLDFAHHAHFKTDVNINKYINNICLFVLLCFYFLMDYQGQNHDDTLRSYGHFAISLIKIREQLRRARQFT